MRRQVSRGQPHAPRGGERQRARVLAGHPAARRSITVNWGKALSSFFHVQAPTFP